MTVINPGGTSVVPIAFGTAAARPAASAANNGTAYYATDTAEVTFSNGAAWNTIGKTSAAQLVAPVFQTANGYQFTDAGAGTGPYIKAASAAGLIRMFGNPDVNSAGSGLQVAEGANAKQGIATLAAGTIVVNTTAVTANSRIFLTPQETGALTGILRVSARTAGTSFTILSSVNTDTAVVAWEIFEPG